MNAGCVMSPIQTELCSQCYSPVPRGSLQCPTCGQKMKSSAAGKPAAAKKVDRDYSRLGFLQNVGSWGKLLLTGFALALPALIFWGAYSYFSNEASKTPFPETRFEVADKFFYALQNDMQNDLQGCYELLTGPKGAQSLIVGSSRDQYIRHLKRIRNYLVQYIGEDFYDKMQIRTNEHGHLRAVLFDEFIQVTPVIVSVWTRDEERDNYGMEDILEFPFPNPVSDTLGISARNEMIDSFMSDAGATEQKERIEIENYKNAKQLDDRHELLLDLIEIHGHEPDVREFLIHWIPENEKAKHLVRIVEEWEESSYAG